MAKARLVPYKAYRSYPEPEMAARAAAFGAELERRRSIRDFAARPVPREVIEACLAAANGAPSGANMQPWHFVAVTDADLKRRIREAAEIEERIFYETRAAPEWLAALEPLGTDWRKPFLEIAPVLIAIFAERFGRLADGRRVKHYYVAESVGIATGFLIAALHRAGLATLTHTPSPMGFLNDILGRPRNEKPYMLLVVGHPTKDAMVPDIRRQPLGDRMSWR